MEEAGTMRAVIAGVGYRHLRDHSLGIVLSDELESLARPPELRVEDLSYNPVAVGQWFADVEREAAVDRVVFVTATSREDGRPAGTICAYRWDRALPEPDQIQRAVTDAVTGIILIDNTLIVAEWMKALPPDVIVVEVEPLAHGWGDEMSPSVAAAYVEVRALVQRLATDDASARSLPVMPLGGGWISTATWSTRR